MDFKKKLKSCFFKSIPYNLSRVRGRCRAQRGGGGNAGEVAQDAQADCDGEGNKQCGGRLTPTPAEGPYLS